MKFERQPNPMFIAFSVVFSALLIPYYFISSPLKMVMTTLLVILLVILLLREYYIIQGTLLIVARGLQNKKIAIKSISMINIAAAGHNTALQLVSHSGTVVTVFPKDHVTFVKALLEINPDIYLQNGPKSFIIGETID